MTTSNHDLDRDAAIAGRFVLLDYSPVTVQVRDDEPTRFIQRKSGTIALLTDGPGGEVHVPIGAFNVALVDIESARNEEPLFDVFDADSQSMCDLYAGLFKGCNYAQCVYRALGDAATIRSSNLLVVERLTVDKAFQGHGLGLAALDGILRTEAVSFGVAVVEPFPLQHSYERGTVPPRAVTRDKKKLMRHYEKLGFVAIPRTQHMGLTWAALRGRKPLV